MRGDATAPSPRGESPTVAQRAADRVGCGVPALVSKTGPMVPTVDGGTWGFVKISSDRARPKKDGLLIDGWDLVTDSATINQKTPETSWAMIRHQGSGPGVPNRGMHDAHVTTLGMQNRGRRREWGS